MKKIFLSLIIICLFISSNIFAQVKIRPQATTVSGKMPEERVVNEDTIEFTNGDKISGDILAISNDTVEFNAKMIPNKCSFPLKNAKLILFPKKIEKEDTTLADQIILPNGDRISMAIKNMDSKLLNADTITGSSVSIEKEKLEGIVFRKVPVEVFVEKFEDAEKNRFTSITGEWVVEGGKYVQKKTNSDSYRASAPLTQQGSYKYSWSVDVSSGGVCGFYFFAKNSKSMNGGDSYYIMVSGRSVYLYKCVSDNQQYYANYNVPAKENIMKFELNYDSANGTILLVIDGQEAIRWKDNSPLDKGKYIILHASQQASFDDIVVSRIGDSLLPSNASDASNNDTVTFVNGDILSGKVVSITEDSIVVENEYDPEGVTIAKTKISSLRFSKGSKIDTPKANLDFRFEFWNNDVITGKLKTLSGDSVTVETESAGELTLPRNLLKSVESPKELKF